MAPPAPADLQELLPSSRSHATENSDEGSQDSSASAAAAPKRVALLASFAALAAVLAAAALALWLGFRPWSPEASAGRVARALSSGGRSGDYYQLFASGEDHVYRIPALLWVDVTGASNSVDADATVLLAFAERRDSLLDQGNISVVLRRSLDGGLSWLPEITVCHFPGETCGNPSPVVDSRGQVHVLLSRTGKGGGEYSGHVNRTVWIASSADAGRTWAPPREITDSTKREEWQWYATGPGHAVRLKHQSDASGRNGRLLVPCDHWELDSAGHKRFRSHVLLSDDDGATWRIGAVLQPPSEREGIASNEATVVERSDGGLVLAARDAGSDCGASTCARLFATSSDGGETWSTEYPQHDLMGSSCQGSLVAVPAAPAATAAWLSESSSSLGAKKQLLLFSFAASGGRQDVLVAGSVDGGRTWPEGASVLVHRGRGGYSDMQALPDGAAAILFERDLEGLTFRRVVPNSSSLFAEALG
eukprot:TRINITY_DN22067_c0_g1_i1.p1 TRINITY_DN22067_c0_g1~~TRINITY_DN22067_c0_g1_i1.p1  ORF type:complete len:477 (-),score=111.03 TRINITY_DN22067_c0_g1_i1:133-1563(-)